MAGLTKRSKVDDSDDESNSKTDTSKDTCDYLTKHAGSGTLLIRSLSELLGSPYDWRSLRVSSHHFSFVGDGTMSPLVECVKKMKAQLDEHVFIGYGEGMYVRNVVAEAALDSPDGDRVCFALRSRRLLGHANAVDMEKMLDVVNILLKKQFVLGWPPLEDDPFSGDLAVLDYFSDDEPEEHDDRKEDYTRQRILADRGAVELIVKIMERWPESPRVQEKGCFLLSKLWGPEDLRRRCVLLVRKAMDIHPKVTEVQIAACNALKHFWVLIPQFLLSVEAVNAVCVAMENHPSSLHVQRAACEFFRWVLPNKANGNERLLEKIRGAPVLKLMLAAVGAHIGKKRFQRDVWNAIGSILHYARDLDFFGSGGVAAMSTALSHMSNEDFSLPRISSFVLRAFKTACKAENAAVHVDEGLMQLVFSDWIKHSCVVQYPEMVDVCKAFGHLAQNAHWAAWLSGKGVVAHIVKFMEESMDFGQFHRRHWSEHPQYTATTYALMNFAQREPLQVDSAIRAVIRAMTVTPKELKMQVRGCAFLASLSWSPANAIKASAFCACEVVVGAMAAHAEEVAMQEQGCLALASLLVHDANRVATAKANGVGALVKAMSKFPDNAAVKEHGRKILKLMSTSAGAREYSKELQVVALLS